MSDAIGKKFGKLEVLKEVPSKVRGHRQYECLCDCGNTHIGTRNNILRGITSQCTACSKSQRTKSQITNGATLHRYTYNSWRSMLLRCAEFDRYKNVPICDEWKNPETGFQTFLRDMGTRPDKHTLDRIDNSKGYTIENCRWATITVQNHNKSKPFNALTSKYKGVSINRYQWAMQFSCAGMKIRESFEDEYSAAIYYDNLSEQYYGDRPNKTDYKEVQPWRRSFGGITYDTRYHTYRVRMTMKDGKRRNFGNYPTETEAEEVLELVHYLEYGY